MAVIPFRRAAAACLTATGKPVKEFKAIHHAAAELGGAFFMEYWGKSCPPEIPITRWLKLIDAARSIDPPSLHLREKLL